MTRLAGLHPSTTATCWWERSWWYASPAAGRHHVVLRRSVVHSELPGGCQRLALHCASKHQVSEVWNVPDIMNPLTLCITLIFKLAMFSNEHNVAPLLVRSSSHPDMPSQLYSVYTARLIDRGSLGSGCHRVVVGRLPIPNDIRHVRPLTAVH